MLLFQKERLMQLYNQIIIHLRKVQLQYKNFFNLYKIPLFLLYEDDPFYIL